MKGLEGIAEAAKTARDGQYWVTSNGAEFALGPVL